MLGEQVPSPTAGTFRIGRWLVDPALDEIAQNGRTIKLEPRTMRLLVRLAQGDGQVVSAQQLLDAVWSGVIVGPASVYQAVSQLRKLLGDTEPNPTYIATIPRKGYRLVACVEAMAEVASSASMISPLPCVGPAIGVEDPVEPPPTTHHWRRWITVAVSMCVIAAAVGVAVRSHWSQNTRQVALVVLPFVDMTPGKTDEAFCDGLTEELSSTLARLPSLRVVSQTSAFAFRDKNVDVREIGRKVSATHALEGSVRRSGNMIRVTAQLVDTRQGYRGWSETYDLPSSDLLRLQSDIAKAVAQELEIRFPKDSVKLTAMPNAVNPAAYEAYLLGRHYYRQRTQEANAKAIELNSRAIALDRNFARAYVGLAEARLNESALAGRPLEELSGQIETLIRAALRLDPDLSEAYATRGTFRADLHRVSDAKQDLRRAIQLDANNVRALASIGRLYDFEGLALPALESFDQAVQLDPLDFMRYFDRCAALRDLGRFGQANEDCATARRLQPDSEWAFIASSWLGRAQGSLADSLRWTEAAVRIAPSRIDIRMDRVDQLLDLGMIAEARSASQQAIDAFEDDIGMKMMQVDVVLTEQGPRAAHAAMSQIDAHEIVTASDLVLALQLSADVGDYGNAQKFAGRLVSSPDFLSIRQQQRSTAKWGYSYLLPLALLDLHAGDRKAAADRVAALMLLLNELEANGYTNWGLNWLRAQALGMMGDPDGAMRALQRAADNGWRGARFARQEPYLASLAGRDDFQHLLSQIDELAAGERNRYEQLPPAASTSR